MNALTPSKWWQCPTARCGQRSCRIARRLAKRGHARSVRRTYQLEDE